MPLKQDKLEQLYLSENKSMQEIASDVGCSVHKVSYWLEKYKIKKRSISDAIYVKSHPGGDPFRYKEPDSIKSAILYGMGLGLYWGEGTKVDKCTIRLGNTDPKLISKFIEFLLEIFQIDIGDLRLSLILHSDLKSDAEEQFWAEHLKISRKQFYKTTIIESKRLGNYRKKSKHGVAIVYYHNKKLRDLLRELMPT